MWFRAYQLAVVRSYSTVVNITLVENNYLFSYVLVQVRIQFFIKFGDLRHEPGFKFNYRM